MSKIPNVKFQLENKYDFLEKISIAEAIAGNENIWFNQSLCTVNSSVMRIGVFTEGEFPMHKHDHDDESFFVLDGSITIETERGDFVLNKFEGVCVPKGVMHRPVVKQKSLVLMIENDDNKPLGDKI